jgi:hypothetical protein
MDSSFTYSKQIGLSVYARHRYMLSGYISLQLTVSRSQVWVGEEERGKTSLVTSLKTFTAP